MKTRRIVRLCIITLRTTASRRINAHPRPPTRPIARPLRHFRDLFPNSLHGSVLRIRCGISFLASKGEPKIDKISPLEAFQGGKKECPPWASKGEGPPWSAQRALRSELQTDSEWEKTDGGNLAESWRTEPKPALCAWGPNRAGELAWTMWPEKWPQK